MFPAPISIAKDAVPRATAALERVVQALGSRLRAVVVENAEAEAAPALRAALGSRMV
jgi:hypothetical protein